MSDLSQPPLSLVPMPEGLAADLSSAGRPEPFAWPTPALPCYPQPMCPLVPEHCEVEGLNGKHMPGRLAAFQPREGQLQLLAPNMRAPLTLRMNQFRRLLLNQPLAPLAGTPGVDPADPLNARPALDYRVEMKDGQPLAGQTIGHLEEDYGLFLFEPVDALGSVRRIFVPHSAYVRVEIGPRIGEVLLEHELTSPGALDEALQTQAEMRSRRLGDMLLMHKVVTVEQLEEAIEQQSRMPMVRVGEALVALGYITEAQLNVALEQQRTERGMPLGELLVRQGVVSRHHLQVALSRKMGYPMVDVKAFPFEDRKSVV